MQTVFFGNGLNRITLGNPSWEDLLKSISVVSFNAKIPNTLKYEASILRQPYKEEIEIITSDGFRLVDRDGYRLLASGERTEMLLKQKIAQKVMSFAPNRVYELLGSLPVNHYITTNYDNTLLKAIDVPYERNTSIRQEKIYSVRRRYTINKQGIQQSYWPIHGNVDTPASIMLGFDQYCGALSKIEGYVKGDYDLPGVGNMDSIAKRLKLKQGEVYSWIDLFFMSDIHIIGFEVAYEEFDIWWLLNRRRRLKQQYEDLINNRIVYYPVRPVSGDKRQLLDSFDVEIQDLPNYKGKYISRYIKQLREMASYITSAMGR